MLTPEEIAEMDKVSGLQSAPKPAAVNATARLAELRALRKPKENVAEKVATFTGGKKLAQGLGQALAQGKTSKQIQGTLDSQNEIQTKLLQKIKDDRTAGKDVSRLENALSLINEDITSTGNTAGILLNPKDLTQKEVVGDALQLATTAGGAKLAGAVVGKAKAATGVVQGLKQGAKAGAVGGAAIGGVGGVASGLEQDKDAAGIALDAGKGALAGGVLGGVLGGAAGGVGGAIKAKQAAKSESYLDAITPKTQDLTPVEYEDLLKRKRITPKTTTKPSEYILSEDEKRVAQKYKSLLENKDPVKNSNNLLDEITKQDQEVGKFLEKNNGIYNNGELKNNLSKKLEDVTDITIDESRLNQEKQKLITNFVNGLKKNDMKSLWQARKEFDQKIESAFRGSPTLQKEMKKALRDGVQDFIAERTPEGVYKNYMREMSQLFNLQENVGVKAAKEKGKNAIQVWMKNNPGKTKLISGLVASGVLTGIGVAAID